MAIWRALGAQYRPYTFECCMALRSYATARHGKKVVYESRDADISRFRVVVVAGRLVAAGGCNDSPPQAGATA